MILFEVGSTADRQDHYELAQPRFGSGLEQDRPPGWVDRNKAGSRAGLNDSTTWQVRTWLSGITRERERSAEGRRRQEWRQTSRPGHAKVILHFDP